MPGARLCTELCRLAPFLPRGHSVPLQGIPLPFQLIPGRSQDRGGSYSPMWPSPAPWLLFVLLILYLVDTLENGHLS